MRLLGPINISSQQVKYKKISADIQRQGERCARPHARETWTLWNCADCRKGPVTNGSLIGWLKFETRIYTGQMGGESENGFWRAPSTLFSCIGNPPLILCAHVVHVVNYTTCIQIVYGTDARVTLRMPSFRWDAKPEPATASTWTLHWAFEGLTFWPHTAANMLLKSGEHALREQILYVGIKL